MKPKKRAARKPSRLVAELRECRETIAMLARQLADKKEIIRRLVT